MGFEEMMAELRKEYVDSIPQKINDITLHLNAKDDAKLRDDFHKIKGTGKTYGIPEISLLGEVIEFLYLKTHDSRYNSTEWALNALKNIHSSRIKNLPFSIESDGKYIELRTLIK